LIDSARTAVTDDNQLAFSVFQQGAGLVDAMAAIESTADNCGNSGLDIESDLAHEGHFEGPVRFDEVNGEFYVLGMENTGWNGVYTDSQLWGNNRFSTDSQLWGNGNFSTDSQLWGNNRFSTDSQLWGNGRFSTDSQLWGNGNFGIDSQLWGNGRFATDSQLWGNGNFSTESVSAPLLIQNKWVDHE
jgi:serine protease AprX